VCHWHSAGSLCWPFPMLKYKYIFADKIYGSNFIKQHSETVMVWNYQNADCSLKKSIYCVIYYNFRHTFVPYMGPDPPTERGGYVLITRDLHNITSICNVFMAVSMWPGHSRLWKQAIWSHTRTIYQKVFEFSEMLRQKIKWRLATVSFGEKYIFYMYINV